MVQNIIRNHKWSVKFKVSNTYKRCLYFNCCKEVKHFELWKLIRLATAYKRLPLSLRITFE